MLFDFGAIIDGYCADLTRTVVVGGRADERQRAVYDTVREAQRRAIEQLRSGMTGREGDAIVAAFGQSLATMTAQSHWRASSASRLWARASASSALMRRVST